MGVLHHKPERKNTNARRLAILSNGALYTGILILIVCFIYMAMHINEADSIISIWQPLVIAGVFMVVISRIVSTRIK